DRQRAGNFTHRTPAGESKTGTLRRDVDRPHGRPPTAACRKTPNLMQEDPPPDPIPPSEPGEATQRHIIDPYGAAGEAAVTPPTDSTNPVPTASPESSIWSRPSPAPDR